MDKKQLETVDLSALIQDYQIVDLHFFKNYLTEIWNDLQLRSKETSIKGIEKHIFAKYYNIPGILIERLFAVFDTNNDGVLDKSEFTAGMQRLFLKENSFDSLARFIFEFYDFDKNGKINKEDVRLVLSYLPSYLTNDKKEQFKDVIDSQDQLCSIINKAFGSKEELDLESFCNVIKTANSDILILVLTYLLERRPF